MEEYERALRSDQPFTVLRDVVQRQLRAGRDRQALEAELQELRERLQVSGRDNDEDVVLDIMDCLVGWCAPQARL